MIGGVELGFRHHFHKMWKFERRYAVRFKQRNERSRKIVDVRNMSQNIIGDGQVYLPALILQFLRQLAIKKPFDDLKTLPFGFGCCTGCGFYPKAGDSLPANELQQIAVVCSDLRNETVCSQPKTPDDLFNVSPGVAQP